MEPNPRLAFWICALAVSFSATCSTAVAQTSAMDGARAAVRETLVDPGSAQFRRMRSGIGGVVCGEYNAKNRMGGYNGFTAFGWSMRTGVFYPPERELEPADEALERLRDLAAQYTGIKGPEVSLGSAKLRFERALSEEMDSLADHIRWAPCSAAADKRALVSQLRRRIEDLKPVVSAFHAAQEAYAARPTASSN